MCSNSHPYRHVTTEETRAYPRAGLSPIILTRRLSTTLRIVTYCWNIKSSLSLNPSPRPSVRIRGLSLTVELNMQLLPTPKSGRLQQNERRRPAMVRHKKRRWWKRGLECDSNERSHEAEGVHGDGEDWEISRTALGPIPCWRMYVFGLP